MLLSTCCQFSRKVQSIGLLVGALELFAYLGFLFGYLFFCVLPSSVLTTRTNLWFQFHYFSLINRTTTTTTMANTNQNEHAFLRSQGQATVKDQLTQDEDARLLRRAAQLTRAQAKRRPVIQAQHKRVARKCNKRPRKLLLTATF